MFWVQALYVPTWFYFSDLRNYTTCISNIENDAYYNELCIVDQCDLFAYFAGVRVAVILYPWMESNATITPFVPVMICTTTWNAT